MVTPCSTCQLISCVNPPDFQTYSLETDAFFSPQFTFVVQCPTGYNCQPGAFPKTITIPAGTFTIPGPIPPANLASFPVQLKCCSSTLTATVPGGSTIAQINAIMAGLFQQCAQQQALCNAIVQGPQIPVLQASVPFVNDVQSLAVCAPGATPTPTGKLPPNILIISNTLIILAGSVSSMVSKSDANTQALNILKGIPLTCVTGIDFNNLIWEFTNGYTIQNAGATGGNSNSYHGAIAVVDALIPSGSNDGWANQALMSYTGPTVSCSVKLTLISFTGGNASAAAEVSVYQDGNQLVIQSVQVFPKTINFTIIAGTNSQIQIGIEPPGGNPVGVAIVCDIVDFPGPNFEGIVKFEFLPHS